MRDKLQKEQGETLIEVLASILIASLSVALLFGSVMTSSRIDREAAEQDQEYYQGLSNAESRSGTVVSGTIKLENQNNSQVQSCDVEIYGGAGMYSYKRSEP